MTFTAAPPSSRSHSRRALSSQRVVSSRFPPSSPADSDSVVHYEVLPDRRPFGGESSDSSNNNRSHNTTTSEDDNTFDSIEIPMGVSDVPGGSGHRSLSHQMHYKVLHDREGHYSYAYDTSMSPAFLIR